MLQLVDVGPRSVSAYREVAPDGLMDALTAAADRLRGARILHVNATPYGGGVSELLRSVVPILNDLGIVAHWRIIRGDNRFFQVTKKIHNGLQGAAEGLTESDREAYLDTSRRNAALLQEDYDFIVLHDPQPAAFRAMHETGKGRWIWRSHIDTSTPNPEVWEFVRGYLQGFDAAVFTMEQFVPPDLPTSHVEIIPPAIDPLSPKNMPLGDDTARRVLEWIGIELDRPLMTQVSRFDPWKDPHGVIEAFQIVRREIPDLQLALVGSMALDDPEGWRMYKEITDAVLADPSVHIFTNLVGIGNVEVNAFQRLSNVVVQKSIREGFGLVVSEAMWKETPIVAGRAGGIPLQMADGAGGILVETTTECAEGVLRILRDRAYAQELGRSGHERVRQQFLIPRLVLNELTLMGELARGWTAPSPPDRFAGRDPVCGMALSEDGDRPSVRIGDMTYRFCSDACHREFLRRPSYFLGRDVGH
jgi:trehalose synthase